MSAVCCCRCGQGFPGARDDCRVCGAKWLDRLCKGTGSGLLGLPCRRRNMARDGLKTCEECDPRTPIPTCAHGYCGAHTFSRPPNPTGKVYCADHASWHCHTCDDGRPKPGKTICHICEFKAKREAACEAERIARLEAERVIVAARREAERLAEAKRLEALALDKTVPNKAGCTGNTALCSCKKCSKARKTEEFKRRSNMCPILKKAIAKETCCSDRRVMFPRGRTMCKVDAPHKHCPNSSCDHAAMITWMGRDNVCPSCEPCVADAPHCEERDANPDDAKAM
jgi:hypothetical protein